MAKTKENAEANVEETQHSSEETPKSEKKSNPLKGIIKSISELDQADRIELYRHINRISNYDHDKASVGNNDASQVFDETLNSLK